MNQRKSLALLTIVIAPILSLGVVYAFYSGSGGVLGVGTPGPCYDVSVIIEYGQSVNQTFGGLDFPEGATAFEALLNVSVVQYDYYGSLVFVRSINGVSNNASANLFWQYYVDGVFEPVASNLCHLGNNSVVEWRYESSRY